jgi:hypothetical protein
MDRAMHCQRTARFKPQDSMRPESIAGHQGSLGSGPELDGLQGPSMKEGGQILDFAVVSLHIGSECRRRPARYQKIS